MTAYHQVVGANIVVDILYGVGILDVLDVDVNVLMLTLMLMLMLFTLLILLLEMKLTLLPVLILMHCFYRSYR